MGTITHKRGVQQWRTRRLLLWRMRKGTAMSYEPSLNDPVFEDEEEELSPEFDTLEEMEVPE